MDELCRIRALNRALEQAAAEGDWLQVAAVDEERARLLGALAPAAAPALRALVEEAHGVTQAVLAQALAARESVMAELRGLQRGKRGANAYHQHP